MTGRICYKLLMAMGDIAAIYTDADNSDVAKIEKCGNRYVVEYNFLTSPCHGGVFDSLKDAKEEVHKLRPKAFLV